MEVVKFTETVFSDSNKKGIITPDSDGYYTLVVGALNTYNSSGEYYTAEGALELFENSSQFMRRIKNGALYCELGHPKKLPGMTNDQFYYRIISIEETNICAHISEISLDFNYGKNNPQYNNPDLIAIIAKVKPAGAKAQALQLALENPKQNAAFSIRGITENKFTNGRMERRLTNIITFDHVTEGGILVADKAHSPALESFNEGRVCETLDTVIDKEALKRVLQSSIGNVSLESNRVLFKDILKSIEGSKVRNRLATW